MRLGRITVILLGLLILLVITYAVQAVNYLRMDVAAGVVTGYKHGKTCVEFDTGTGIVEVCRDLPRYYLTGYDALMIYDPDKPGEAELNDFGYWLDKQYFPMFLVVAWLVFSASYFSRNEVLVASLKRPFLRKEAYGRGRFIKGNRSRFS